MVCVEVLEACERAPEALEEVLELSQEVPKDQKAFQESPDVFVPDRSSAGPSGKRMIDGEEEPVRK